MPSIPPGDGNTTTQALPSTPGRGPAQIRMALTGGRLLLPAWAAAASAWLVCHHDCRFNNHAIASSPSIVR